MTPLLPPPGEESVHEYLSPITLRPYIQYDYRSIDGRLFSCATHTIEDAHQQRNDWFATLAPLPT